jgi:20S proteasome subunit beta 4
VNLLLGGYDKSEGPSLYFFDYLGSMHKMEFGTHGYASYFITSVFDKYYRKDLSKKEGLELMRRCIDELKKRFAIRVGNFVVKIVDEKGARVFGADEEIEL